SIDTVVVTGVTGCTNRGVEALLQTSIVAIREVYSPRQIVVLTTSPFFDSRCIPASDVQFRLDAFRTIQGRIATKLGRGRRLAGYLSTEARRAVDEYDSACRTVESSQLVVASGGDVFSEA